MLAHLTLERRPIRKQQDFFAVMVASFQDIDFSKSAQRQLHE